ncbi:polar amino acid transport system substrate-binding protein [Reichenbachiella agariperforans]|uniref:Polar amino acid transport system substrate-binding protein n=1 Tax=Reichenbachiella agariperforans TaxID=156994 RepID=A0A1M6RK13_REIAG|nr:transporter substrate-binding domain-containing protein [Reichenbachiella agariperforans]SHK32793.1 polar amino acid transport system substrate-binding protein [Reichenbachiella agariperforans]
MKTIKTYLLVAVILLTANTLFAQDRLSKIVESGELRVGLTGTQPPFSMKAKNNELIGFDVDLANLLATSMELKLILVELPFAELLPGLANGQVDLVISGMTITPARNLKTAFVGPYLISGKSILTKSKVLANVTNPQDINTNRKVVTLKGSTSQKFAEKHLTDVDLELVDNYDIAIDKIRNDESEIMIADYPTCAYAMLKFPNDELVILDRPMTIEPIGIALPNDDALFVNLVDNYIESLEAAGVLEMMEQKWFENPYWLAQLK